MIKLTITGNDFSVQQLAVDAVYFTNGELQYTTAEGIIVTVFSYDYKAFGVTPLQAGEELELETHREDLGVYQPDIRDIEEDLTEQELEVALAFQYREVDPMQPYPYTCESFDPNEEASSHSTQGMTQEKADQMFSQWNGELDVIYSTSDNRCFIRYEEARKHTEGELDPNTQPLEDKNIIEWHDSTQAYEGTGHD